MNNKWTKVYASTYLHQVEIAKAILKENEIDAIIKNMQDSLYQFGEIELFVRQENTIKAKQIIQKTEL